MDSTSGAGTYYSSGAQECIPSISEVCITISLVLCVMLCRLLFILFLLVIVLSVLLRFTDSDYLLVSSNSSYKAILHSLYKMIVKLYDSVISDSLGIGGDHCGVNFIFI